MNLLFLPFLLVFDGVAYMNLQTVFTSLAISLSICCFERGDELRPDKWQDKWQDTDMADYPLFVNSNAPHPVSESNETRPLRMTPGRRHQTTRRRTGSRRATTTPKVTQR